MALPNFRFEIVGKARANDAIGRKMIRLTLRAAPSEAFVSDEPLPDGMYQPAPDFVMIGLVSESFAKGKDIGDLIDFPWHEVRP
jgi:hypothetical protein